jgi:hypothetical protein
LPILLCWLLYCRQSCHTSTGGRQRGFPLPYNQAQNWWKALQQVFLSQLFTGRKRYSCDKKG